MRHCIFCLLIILSNGIAFAQTPTSDSTFSLQSFGYGDIVTRPPTSDRRIEAASRMEENADELPVRTYVITREEIREQGYVTLVDVLKDIPGFRVSQPGSALLGETFTMRGLLGNEYTQIRVNGLPVKPSGAPGMPLGANLPIKQAERIEIILGPAAAVYGSDALAGVINIVLPQVVRPVEVMADIGMASGGLSEMFLSLGGRVGKNDNILDYSLYASSRQTSDLFLNTDEDLFRVDSSLVGEELYVGNGTNPEVNGIHHDSRLIGAKLDFRGLRLGYQMMQRYDHSALGSHPEEISYHNPNTMTGEIIQHQYLQYNKRWNETWNSITNASVLRYEMDEESRYYGVEHPVASEYNFQYAGSYDVYLEQLVGMQGKNFNALGGLTYQYASGESYFGHYWNPYGGETLFGNNVAAGVVNTEWSLIDSLQPINTSYEYDQISGVLQFSYHGDKFNLNAGLRADLPDDEELKLSPKFGAFYKLNEKTSFRAFIGSGFKAGSEYNKQYAFRAPPPQQVGDELVFRQERRDIISERFYGLEGGVTHRFSEVFTAEAHVFFHVLENSIFPILNYPAEPDSMGGPPPPPPAIDDDTQAFIGFSNTNSISTLAGYQLFLNYEKGPIRAELSGTIYRGSEELDSIAEIQSYRSVPEYSVHLKLRYRTEKGLSFGASSYLMGATTGSVIERNNEIIIRENEGYHNLDLLVTKKLSDTFSASLKVTNVTNTATKGIYSNAFTGIEFDYMPQLTRMTWLRLTYTLN